VSSRRLYHLQPESFAFNAENYARARHVIAKYPQGRQASAVISLLWIGQEQEGWVSQPMIEEVAKMLAMPPIRVLEVATFYTMFRLAPAGKHVVQVCTCVPCCLNGSDELVKVCKKHIAEKPNTVSADGALSWEESECLGACVNAPLIQVDADTYEDLTPERAAEIIEALRRGDHPKPGPQNGRKASEPQKDKV
jgi:NADH-quinone oxidoreductase subunit E